MTKRFNINSETAAIFSHFDHLGNEKTIVYQGNSVIYLPMPPQEVVTKAMEHLGYNFQGAIKGAQSILDRKSSVPFAYLISAGIVLIPTPTANKMGKVFLVSSHIKRIMRNNKTTSIVRFYNGRSMIVGMKYDRLRTQVTEASHLYLTMLERSQEAIINEKNPFDRRMSYYGNNGKGSRGISMISEDLEDYDDENND